MKKATIKDIAREAGVTISTVSNALNHVDVLRPETKAHILEVADRLKYIPNVSGRNLRAKSTGVLGLFVTSMKGIYYGTLADKIHEACEQNGYELNIFLSGKSGEIMANILGKRIDGAIILNEHLKDAQESALKKAKMPVVFLDREIQSETMSSLLLDSYHSGVAAGQYLLSLGHRSFGFLQGPLHNYDNLQRFRGYTHALEEAGYSLPPENIFHGAFDRDVAYQTTMKLLETRRNFPQAVFAGNDLSAIGFIEALKSYHFSVPEKISVIGCDDIELGRWFIPRLTTINTSYEAQGSMAVSLLLDLVRGKEKGRIQKLESKIRERDSCLERIGRKRI